MTTMLELAGVSMRFGAGSLEVSALSEVSLQVEEGEFLAIMGPSGSGKTTALSLAGGLVHPTAGSVRVRGTDLSTLSIRELSRLRRRWIGFVFQQLNLVESLTARENVSLPLELDGVRRAAAGKRAVEALSLVGMEGLRERFPDELSGGEQQRVAIARAIVGEGRLVLADEPTGALDSKNGEAVLRLLRAQCERGGSVVLVTHDARFAAWADRVIFVRDGRVTDQTWIDGPDTLLVSTPR